MIERRKKITELMNDLPPEKKEILKNRALLIGQTLTDKVHTHEMNSYLTFSPGKERYGIPILGVVEIQPLVSMTYVPKCPPYIAGIINNRGTPVLIIDVRKFFNLPLEGVTDLTHIVIIQDGEIIRGILASDIVKEELSQENIHAGTSLSADFIQSKNYILGITNTGVLILNVPAILNDPAIRLASKSPTDRQ